MTLDEFHAKLHETGDYDTEHGGATAINRLMGRFDWWFYIRILSSAWRYSFPALMGRYGLRHWARNSFSMLSIYEECGASIRIRGADRVHRHQGPVVYAANHMSMAETVLLPCILLSFGPLTVVVKRSLLRYPAFGPILRNLSAIGVTRSNPREDFRIVMEEGAERLARGISVLVFPQSRRNAVFDRSAFNTIAVKLAKRAGVPVIPVALRTDFHGLGAVLKDFGRLDRSKAMHFCLGPPMVVGARDRDAHHEVVAYLEQELRRMGLKVSSGSA